MHCATEPLQSLAGMLESGELVAPEIRTLSLEEAADALAAVATGHVRGKVVVEMT